MMPPMPMQSLPPQMRQAMMQRAMMGSQQRMQQGTQQGTQQGMPQPIPPMISRGAQPGMPTQAPGMPMQGLPAFRMGGMPHMRGAPAAAPLGMAHNPLQGGMHRLGMGSAMSLRPKFQTGGQPVHPAVARAMMLSRQPLARAPMPIPQRPAMPMARGPMPMPQRPPQPQGEPIHKGGPLRSPVPGRTDHIKVTVPDGAYVIPADVVNHFGEDNTEAGHERLDELFKGTAIAKMHQVADRTGPRQPLIPIAAAGGEYVVPPETVSHIGGGNMHRGHAILDGFLKIVRAAHIKTLKRLPGPQK